MTFNKHYRPKLIAAYWFDIIDYAAYVEIDLAHLLRTAVRGVYSRRTGELLIDARQCGVRLGEAAYYYHDNIDRMFVPVNHIITGVQDLRGPVYDAEFNTLISQAMIDGGESFLCDAPYGPTTGLSVIELFIANYIDQRLRWKTAVPDVWFELAPYIEGVWHDSTLQTSAYERESRGSGAWAVQYELVRRLEKTLQSLLAIIKRVLPLKTTEWAIIKVTRRAGQLRVRVFEDYRICEWMNEHDQGRNLQSLQTLDSDIEEIAQLWRADDE